MLFDLLKVLIRGAGVPFIRLDIAVPGPLDVIAENYPIVILAILAVIAVIVILVSRFRRRRQERYGADPSDRSENK